MSFNSPFSNPDNQPRPELETSEYSQNNNQDTPRGPVYGETPHVQPTGKTSIITIVGFVLSIIVPLIGIIVSIVAWKQAAETGDNKGLAKAGIIVGTILFGLSIIYSYYWFDMLTTATVNGTLSSS